MNKAIFERKTLLDALKRGGVSATTNGTVPILENVKITADGEGVKITSSNLQTETNVFCKAEQMPLDYNIDVCVNAKTITDIMQSVNDYNITLEFGENQLKVCYGAGVMTIPTLPTDEFPSMAKTEEPKAVFEIDNATLRYIVNSAQPFAGKDELRPNMMGVYMGVKEDNTIEYCATDAHRLICETVNIGNFVGEPFEMIVPSEASKSIVNAAQDEGSAVIRKFDGSISVTTDACTLTTVLREGKYPNFHNIIPQPDSVNHIFRVRRNDITNALKRMMTMMSITTYSIRLNFGEGGLEMSAEDLDYGKSGVEKMAAERIQGDNITIGFNGVFLSACLGETESEFVKIRMTAPSRAMVVEDETRPQKTVLLMPITLNY